MNWNNVTIGMLQQIAAYKTDNPIKRAAHDISVITGTPLEVINKWKLNELKSSKFNFLTKLPNTNLKYTFKHNGRRFKLIKNAKDMKAHHFIELQEVVNDDIISNLHIIIALLCNRVNIFGKEIEDDYDWKVENFKDLPCPQFYTYAVFFSLLFPKLLTATQNYLKENQTEENQELLDGLVSLIDLQEVDEQNGI